MLRNRWFRAWVLVVNSIAFSGRADKEKLTINLLASRVAELRDRIHSKTDRPLGVAELRTLLEHFQLLLYLLLRPR